jgi:hypothetical protein
MGPQIGQLLEAFQALGLQVPDWLADVAEKAKEAGASLEPPEGLPDILKDIRDILLEIGKAFGVAAGEAGKFGRAAGAAADEAARTRGPGRRGPDASFQHETPPGGALFTRPSLISVAERRPERVWVQNEGGRPPSGGGGIQIGTIQIDVHDASDPSMVVAHIKANLGQSLNEIFRAAKQKGHI